MSKTGQVSFAGLFFSPTFPSLGAAYCQYGRDQGEAPTGAPVPPATPDCADDGVDNATLMGWLYKNKFIDGYVEVPLDQLDWYAQTFKGIVLGLVIDGDKCITDFQASPKVPWDTMGKDDGHDTLGIITHADGSGALVTWGGVQPYTLGFRQNNITDAWVILDSEDPYPDWTALSAALTALHGVVGPDPYSASIPAKESFLEEVLDKVRTEFHGLEESKTFEAAEKRAKELEQGLHKAMGLALSRESEQLILKVLQQIVKAYIKI